jgi:acetyl-CoA/propionyl-CoA carboxylase, biotin carboxylase, biotin carboxyl carrier protein
MAMTELSHAPARIATVLIANRGEIAVRIIRTLRTLGITSVAVYSQADRNALHVRMADRAVLIGDAPAAQSYLRHDAIIAAAVATGADAVHPGYGFLSENAEFAQACVAAGLIFIGPSADAIAAMGDKIAARHRVAAAGVPVVPGAGAAGMSDAELVSLAAEVGYPILIKPSAGGGGKGMRPVRDAGELPAALSAARREAAASFGDDTLLLERLISRPRHIEIQVLVDSHGNAVHLGERECSLQRRHQKIVEEAPSILLDAAGRERLGALAIQAAHACGYVNAGTVEFICSSDRPDEMFFMEMNTRLQVEHPVTEQVWGVDLVAEQINIARGHHLGFTQADLIPAGHAIEARIYAEDPSQGFLPSPGQVIALHLGQGHSGIRVDSGVEAGDEIPGHYDPMIAKVIATGVDRTEALQRLQAALVNSRVVGIASNIGFLASLLDSETVRHGEIHTELVETLLETMVPMGAAPQELQLIAALGFHLSLAHRGTLRAGAAPWNDHRGWRLGSQAETIWRLTVPSSAGVMEQSSVITAIGITELEARPQSVHQSGEYSVRIVGHDAVQLQSRIVEQDSASGSMKLAVLINEVSWIVQIDPDHSSPGNEPGIWVSTCGVSWYFAPVGLNAQQQLGLIDSSGVVVSPMPGTVVAVVVSQGETVIPGQPIAVVEAMKMEHTLRSGIHGVVTHIGAVTGDKVARGAVLAQVEPLDHPISYDAKGDDDES